MSNKPNRHIGYSEGGLVAVGEDSGMMYLPKGTSVLPNSKQTAIYEKGDEVKMDKPSARINNPKRYCRHVCLDCGHEDRVDGHFHEVINCPKCNGLYVDTFRVLHYQALLRPDKSKDEITACCKGCGYKVKGTKDLLDRFICPECKRGSDTPRNPLLSIVLDDINSMPTVHYKGEEITFKQRIVLDWETADEHGLKPTYLHIEHLDSDRKAMNSKIIQHNHSRIESD